jgi:SAM-dependent methyltransferase
MEIREQRPADSAQTFSRGAGAYRTGIAAFTATTAERLADRAGIQRGDLVVDLGTGPGVVAAVAVARGARCVGLDNARGMLVEARKLVPEARWVLASGHRLPFAPASADVITAAYAFGCVAPGGKLSESLMSTLRSGGRLAFSNWVPEASANIQILREVLAEHGDPRAPEPPKYPEWLFPPLDFYQELVRSPGLLRGGAELVLHHWILQSPYELFDALLEINPRLQGHSPPHLERIRAATASLAERHRQGSCIYLPMKVAYGWAHAA